MSLATRLKDLRLRKGKSLQQVADIVGSTKAHVWDLEQGRAKNPSMNLLIEFSRCFEVPVAELVGETLNAEKDTNELMVMYRDLKDLSDSDREAIKAMMEHLRKRGETKEGS
jgi:transcriptional regulator with XRE-family HTH domain